MSWCVVKTLAGAGGGAAGCGVRRMRTSTSRALRLVSLKKVTNQPAEPHYLTPREKLVPVRPLVNIQLKSYDFAVLENYAKWVHKSALAMDLDVSDSWATPHTSSLVTRLKPSSSTVAATYNLNLYERNVQVSEVSGLQLPRLLDLLASSLPAGLWLRVHQHQRQHAELRYVPDLQLKELKQQLSEVGQDPDKRKRK